MRVSVDRCTCVVCFLPLVFARAIDACVHTFSSLHGFGSTPSMPGSARDALGFALASRSAASRVWLKLVVSSHEPRSGSHQGAVGVGQGSPERPGLDPSERRLTKKRSKQMGLARLLRKSLRVELQLGWALGSPKALSLGIYKRGLGWMHSALAALRRLSIFTLHPACTPASRNYPRLQGADP